MNQAQGRLDDVIDSEVRKVISKNPLREAVRDSNVISQIKRNTSWQAWQAPSQQR